MTPDIRIRRFTPVQRLFHFGLLVLFMALSLTGVALLFTGTVWGDFLLSLTGGYQGTLDLHRWIGLAMIAGAVLNALYMVALIDWSKPKWSLFGPDSLMILGRDLKEFAQHLGWVVGLAKAPVFERWSWWQKFDYWAVWWGILLLALTGLMLYDPLLSSEYMPGWMFNVALWIHRIEAVLAMGHIFTVHFFVENIRPHGFPFSATMFDGGIKRSKLASEHGAWLKRLEADGQLQQQVLDAVPVPLRVLYFGFGYLIIALGVYLLIYGLLNASLLMFYGS